MCRSELCYEKNAVNAREREWESRRVVGGRDEVVAERPIHVHVDALPLHGVLDVEVLACQQDRFERCTHVSFKYYELYSREEHITYIIKVQNERSEEDLNILRELLANLYQEN